MKYIKGNQSYKLEECEFVKLRLVDGDDFAETPWGKRFKDTKESVLQNHAIAFYPFPSWGAVLPVTNTATAFNFIDTLEKGELTLHPEAWDSYLKDNVIDENGNYIFQEEQA